LLVFSVIFVLYSILVYIFFYFFFFFNDTATTEIYTLSLHDALPICAIASATASSAASDANRQMTSQRIRGELLTSDQPKNIRGRQHQAYWSHACSQAR